MSKFICPFDPDFTFHSPLELVSHLKKCIRARDHRLYFCSNSLGHVFLCLSDLKQHEGTCNANNRPSDGILKLFPHTFVVNFITLSKLESLLRYDDSGAKESTNSFKNSVKEEKGICNLTPTSNKNVPTPLKVRSTDNWCTQPGITASIEVVLCYRNSRSEVEEAKLLQFSKNEENRQEAGIQQVDISRLQFQLVSQDVCNQLLKKQTQGTLLLLSEFLSGNQSTADLFETTALRCALDSNNLLFLTKIGSTNNLDLRNQVKLGHISLWFLSAPMIHIRKTLGLEQFEEKQANHQPSEAVLKNEIAIQKAQLTEIEQENKLLIEQIKECESQISHFRSDDFARNLKQAEEALLKIRKTIEELQLKKKLADNRATQMIEHEVTMTLTNLNQFRKNRFLDFEKEVSAVQKTLSVVESDNRELERENEIVNQRKTKRKLGIRDLQQKIKDTRGKITEVQIELDNLEFETSRKIDQRSRSFIARDACDFSKYRHCCLDCRHRIVDNICIPCQHLNKVCFDCLRSDSSTAKFCKECRRPINKVIKLFL